LIGFPFENPVLTRRHCLQAFLKNQTWLPGKIPALNGGVKLGICHRIIWRASSRGVASNDLELENAKGIPRESDKELKESKQKLQNARKI
jgi:hypothetical protein